MDTEENNNDKGTIQFELSLIDENDLLAQGDIKGGAKASESNASQYLRHACQTYKIQAGCEIQLCNFIDAEKALNLAREVLEIWEKGGGIHKDRRNFFYLKGAIWGAYGVVYKHLKRFEEAQSYFIDALGYFKSIEYDIGLAVIHNGLGNLYIKLENYPKAEPLFLEALEINNKHSIYEEISTTLINLGVLYMDQGEADEALDYYYRALELEKRKAVLASLHANLGLVYLDTKDLHACIAHFERANKLYAEMENVYRQKQIKKFLKEAKAKIQKFQPRSGFSKSNKSNADSPGFSPSLSLKSRRKFNFFQ